jgi:membrane protease subunit HflC
MVVLAGLVVLALLASTVAYQVDELKDIVLVKRFGRVDRALYGSAPGQAGLAMKWPWPIEKVVRYDSRMFIFEDPYQETSTADNYNLLVSMYCTWRIRDAEKFHRAVETVEAARERLRDRVRQNKGAVIGRRPMRELINTDPAEMKLEEIEKEILAEVRREVQDVYGVEIGMVRIKLWGLPEQVSPAVIDTQKKERERFAQEYKARGEAEASAIREWAKSARDQIVEFAKRKAADIETEGVRAAAELYGEFRKNPELSMFLRSLESLRAGLQDRAVILLTPDQHPAVRFFRDGPSLSAFSTSLPATQPAGNKPVPRAVPESRN